MRGGLLVACLAVACAHQARTPPLTGWQELQSAHFRMRTNLAPGAAEVTLRRLETLRTALQSEWLVPGDTPDTADVIVLADTTELLTFTDWLGLTTVSGPRPLLVTAAGPSTDFQEGLPYVTVLAHELTHVLSRWRMPSAAPWFEEGLAELLGTVQLPEEGRAIFGRRGIHRAPPAGRYLAGRVPSDPSGTSPRPRSGPGGAGGSAWVLPLDDLTHLPWQFPTPEAAGIAYRSARLWVQVLRLREPDRVLALERAPRAGIPWGVAWSEARRGLDVGELRAEIRRWAVSESLPSEERRFSVPEAHSTARAMAPWETRLVLAELWALGGTPEQRSEHLARARAELESAAGEAPAEAPPQVRLARMEADPETRLAKAEAIARAHPESPEAAVFLAAVLRDDGRERDGRAQAIARAVALAPDDPDAITADAVEKARTGRVDAALEAAGRAVAVAPWSPVVFRVQANLLAAVGRCEEALDRTRRAQEVLPHRAPPELVDAVQHDLELIRGKCSRAQAAARSCYRSRGPGSLRARLRPRQVLRRARRFR